ncbi:MAG: hypothetical protein EU547_06390 [Promethearchaeota archaeon]|nr:MAG: hypothetical protein EU547_06390 [Candidatus Lokiarchaeota archaeon]
MVSSIDRILNALELKEPIDRIPKMELFANILPTIKYNINFQYFPKRVQHFVLKFVEKLVIFTKRNLKMIDEASMREKKDPTSLVSELLANIISENLSASFTSDKNFLDTTREYLKTPIKLGYDAWSLISLFWPGYILGMVKTGNKNQVLSREGAIFDIDTDLEILSKSVLFPNNYLHQIQFETEFYNSLLESEDLDIMAEKVRKIMESKILGKKIKDQIVAYPMIPGIYETWLYTFGVMNMTQFHRVTYNEWRNGCKGPYHDLLELKVKVYTEYIKRLAEVDGVIAFCNGDDSAILSGPMSNPNLFHDYIAPLTKKIVDQVHQSGLKYIFHSDGNFKMEGREKDEEKWFFMNTIIDTGIDALHPIEMKANDIEEIKEAFGNKICLCNGIDTMELQDGTPKSIARCTFNVLKKVYKGSNGKMNGYIAGSDNSIHGGTKIPLWKQMLFTVDEFSEKYNFGKSIRI